MPSDRQVFSHKLLPKASSALLQMSWAEKLTREASTKSDIIAYLIIRPCTSVVWFHNYSDCFHTGQIWMTVSSFSHSVTKIFKSGLHFPSLVLVGLLFACKAGRLVTDTCCWHCLIPFVLVLPTLPYRIWTLPLLNWAVLVLNCAASVSALGSYV